MAEVKSFPFPVLSTDRADYDICCEYTPSIKARMQGSDKVDIHHVFSGGGLIADLLESGRAVFGCIISLPSTMYRRVEVKESSGLICEQSINYGRSGYEQDASNVESPFLRPVILTHEDIEKTISEADKLNSAVWESGIQVKMPIGSIIAYGEWQRFGGCCSGMFKVELGKGMNPGQMSVSDDISDGFRFILRAEERLYHSIKYNTELTARQRSSVLTHAVSSAFSLLKEKKDDYGDREKYGEHINLRLLADFLIAEGHGDWCDEDFQPEMAATALYPHIFPGKNEEDDD